MQSYENNFHFANLILEVLKMISSHYNQEISPTPTGYMGQTHLVFAQTKFEAVAQPAQKAGPSILLSIPQRVKNLEIKKKRLVALRVRKPKLPGKSNADQMARSKATQIDLVWAEVHCKNTE